jgi:tetratricopeptide (TPR) repeat protein
MNEPHDPHRTVDEAPSAPADSLDAGLAAGFARPAQAPRSSLDASQRPVLLKEAEGDSAHVVKPNSDAMPAKEKTGDRYQLQGEIARGGMGAVLRGRDVDLGRDLAVKVLLEKHADRPEVVRRFIEEAQIGGQLQHPGVVPVYDIGRFGERPFFTMKFVKGHTLQALLAERGEPSADRPRFLAIVLQVAQAVAYAHAKGVIHRDLKPSNVMVGAFGEVQVMDWGLAKVLAEGGVADEERASRQQQQEDGTLIRTARSGGTGFGTDTEAGSLLGTPAYMPPEQAQGDVAQLDRRADVFGLGAILCQVLTGKPPYVGRSNEEVRRMAANAAQADAAARLDGCGADPELVALTKACLAPETIDRPKDARAVAEGLSAYLNGVQQRLQTAQRERAVALAREGEQRKRRKVQLALAAALVALLLGGGAFAWWRNEQAQLVRQREARNAEAVAALLKQCEDALVAGDAAKAAVALDAAKERSEQGGAEEQAQQLGRLVADLAVLKDLDAVDQFLWTWTENSFPSGAALATRTQEALARFGVGAEAVSEDEAAARVSASVVRERIVSALDRLLWLRKTAAVRAVLRRVDAEPYRDAVRDAILARDWAKFTELAGQQTALEQPPGFVAFLGELPAIEVKRRRHLLAVALNHWPGNLALLMTLGQTYHNQKESANERLRWYQAAVAAAPANSAAHNNLGNVLHRKGQWDEAIACYRKAIALDPKLALAHYNLGNALYDKGQVDEAIACYQKAIALDPKFAPAHDNLGNALYDKGQVDDAIACYQKAIARDPKDAKAHNNLGGALRAKGRLDEAIACFRKAIALDPKYAMPHCNLGNALSDKGQVDEAIACFKKAIALDPKFANAHYNLGYALYGKGQWDEAMTCYQKAIALDPNFALAHNNLGTVLQGKGKVEEAIACWRKAIALDPKYAMPHCNLGNALRARGQVDEAIACFKKAIALDPKLAAAYSNLGIALRARGQVDEAIACFKKAIALDLKLAGAHDNLGHALSDKGQVDEAIACFKKAIALDPKYAGAHSNLGMALYGKGQVDVAIACFKKAIALDPKFANAHFNLGNALFAKGRLEEAIACWRKAIALDPKFASAHFNLGHALAHLGRFAESLAAIKRGHELGTKQPGWRHPSAAWVRQAERLAALEAKLPALLKGEYQPKDPAERLGLAVVCRARKLHAAAARLSADAFAADPRLADDLGAGHRYYAAGSAALAAAGQCKDAGKLDDRERARLRQQALGWLRADLALWTRQADKGTPQARAAVKKWLQTWLNDAGLLGVRDESALARLPAEEQAAWRKLWDEVAKLAR